MLRQQQKRSTPHAEVEAAPRKRLRWPVEQSSVVNDIDESLLPSLGQATEPIQSSNSATVAPTGMCLVETLDDHWVARLQDLRSFKCAHGHVIVPKKYPENPSLGLWVMNQRQQKKLYNEGKMSTMTPERICALENLGFVWSLCEHVHWKSRLEELRIYQAKHGDCLVPNKFESNPKLGTWVNKQRNQYKLMREGKPSSMTQERVEMLESLGFAWSKRDIVDWNTRLNQIRQYKAVHGDCLVPNKYPDMHQRAQYRKWKEGKKKVSRMTACRVRALEEVGFVWSTSNLDDADWDDRLRELWAYREEHGGDCRVPSTFASNRKLSAWVGKMRKQFKRWKEGKPSMLTKERVDILDAMGFNWSLRRLVNWEARFQQLRAYKEKNGDCLVPQQYQTNPQLGTWVSNQRKQYRLLKEGKPSPMDADRINALESLGFVWSIFHHEKYGNGSSNRCESNTFCRESQRLEKKAYHKTASECRKGDRIRSLMPEEDSNSVILDKPYETKLAAWTMQQREQYKLFIAGKPSHMTAEQAKELERLGLLAWCRSRHPSLSSSMVAAREVSFNTRRDKDCPGTHKAMFSSTSTRLFRCGEAKASSKRAAKKETEHRRFASDSNSQCDAKECPDKTSHPSSGSPKEWKDHELMLEDFSVFVCHLENQGKHQAPATACDVMHGASIDTASNEFSTWDPLPTLVKSETCSSRESSSSSSISSSQPANSSDWIDLFDPLFP